ncbi:hypothetical protein [Thermosporothrix hazakensis]|uniref:hypothetical protein n=1 Tax=Thermosporothrix hazakensis TaxID=644383 RepID=UPI0010F75934|nr:hypothetical protein [Thermosporothrix hazakensis]
MVETSTAALMYGKQPAEWLVLLGLSGCGKTHLAVAITRSKEIPGSGATSQVSCERNRSF